MLQFWGTLAISALGGAFFIHYLKNFLLAEKIKFAWDWDGVIERSVVTFVLISSNKLFFLIPTVIALKIIFRLATLNWCASRAVAQQVQLKAELAFELILSPIFALLIGIIF